MSYEVTKHIKGGSYRYRVDTVRDPQTGMARPRWHYLGRLDGDRLVAPVRTGRPRITRDELVAITARLLESRDASRVTVGVIAQHAGISPGTFYRQFGDRHSALVAALALLGERFVRDLPSLSEPLGTREDERERFAAWFAAFYRLTMQGRAFRWFLTEADGETHRATREHLPRDVDPHAILAAYLERLDAAGYARIDDAGALADAVLALYGSLVRDVAGNPEPGDAEARWRTAFPVFDRAVFAVLTPAGAAAGQGAPVTSQTQARDRLSHDHRDRSASA